MYWLTKFIIVGITYNLPTRQPEQYVGVGSINQSIFTPLPAGGQFDNLGSNRAPIAQNQVSFRGSIALLGQTASQLEQQEIDLRSMTGKRGTLYRKWDNSGLEQFCDARLLSFNANRSINNLNSLDLELTFQIISPVWSGASHSLTFTKSQISSGGGYVSLPNNGNADQLDVTITITASGSNITGSVIQKTSASGSTIYDDLTYAGSLAPGQQAIIDTGAYTVLKQGVSDYGNFALGANHREDNWFRLWATNNRIPIALTGGDNASSVKFDYYDAWI